MIIKIYEFPEGNFKVGDPICIGDKTFRIKGISRDVDVWFQPCWTIKAEINRKIN